MFTIESISFIIDHMRTIVKNACIQSIDIASAITGNRYNYFRSILREYFDDIYEAQIDYIKNHLKLYYHAMDKSELALNDLKYAIDNFACYQTEVNKVLFGNRSNGKTLNCCKIMIIQACYDALLNLLKSECDKEVDK